MESEEVRALLFKLFQRHFVALRVSFTKPDAAPKNAAYSAFIMSVADRWYLITAGHCIDEIAEALKQGFSISCELFDNLDINSKFKRSIPFAYEPSETISLVEFGADFGVIELRDMYRKLLAANDMEPLAEKGWRFRPENYEPFKYLLLGIPNELTRQQGQVIQYMPSIHPVEKLAERPDYTDEPTVPTFYGKIVLGDDLSSIRGMSGGPIFSLQEINGSVKYWLHALQSSWFASERVVVAPLIESLGYVLERVHEFRLEHERQQAAEVSFQSVLQPE